MRPSHGDGGDRDRVRVERRKQRRHCASAVVDARVQRASFDQHVAESRNVLESRVDVAVGLGSVELDVHGVPMQACLELRRRALGDDAYESTIAIFDASRSASSM